MGVEIGEGGDGCFEGAPKPAECFAFACASSISSRLAGAFADCARVRGMVMSQQQSSDRLPAQAWTAVAGSLRSKFSIGSYASVIAETKKRRTAQ